MAYVIRAAFESHDPLQAFTTVLHYKSLSDSASVDDFVSGVDGTLTTGLRASLGTDGLLDSVTAVRIPEPGTSQTPDEATRALALAGAYNPGGDNLPEAMCGLVQLKTGVASRRARGWTYAYPMRRTTVLSADGEQILSSGDYWIAMGTLATGLTADVIGDGVLGIHYTPIVFSRRAYDQNAANWYFGITAAVRSSKPRWLRKRSII